MTLSRYWSIIGIICESEKRSLNPANETVLSWSLVIDIRVESVVSCLMNFNNHNNNNYYDCAHIMRLKIIFGDFDFALPISLNHCTHYSLQKYYGGV